MTFFEVRLAKKNKAQMTSRKNLYIITGVIFVVIIAVLIYMFTSTRIGEKALQLNTNQKIRNSNQGLLPLPTSIAVPPEIDLVYTNTGRVAAIDKNTQTVSLETSYGVKQVLYTPQTIWVTKKQPTIDELKTLTSKELAERMQIENPMQGELKAGDMITAQSATNISGKSTFTAIKITLIQ